MFPRLSSSLTTLALVLASTSLLAHAPRAQKSKLPKNDPGLCPYCGGEPARMAAAGLRSHGGFAFGSTDTAAVDKLLASVDLYWIESEHFEIGLGLGSYKPKQSESKSIRAELTELAKVLPEVKPKTRMLDPWLRAHLYAWRVERTWDRWVELIRVDPGVFPTAEAPKLIGAPYFGEGPYLGQKGKYELLVLPTPELQVSFLKSHFGLSVERSQRWNVIERDTLISVTNLSENDLRTDTALHGHVAFNLTALMLDGFKHYSYDVPRWLTESLAHLAEREISPDFNTFDKSEGATPERSKKKDWDKEVKKLLQTEKAPRLAQIASVRTFAEFSLADHHTMWSMAVYMTEDHPEALACLINGIKGRRDSTGMPDGSNIFDVQRNLFRTCFGMTYGQFDQAWSAWALVRQ